MRRFCILPVLSFVQKQVSRYPWGFARMSKVSSDKTKAANVLSLTAERAKRPVPSLKELCTLDKDVLEFFKLVQEEDLREEAKRLLNREITKKRPIPIGVQK